MVEGGAMTVVLGALLLLSVLLNILLFYVSSELKQELRELKYGTKLSREELESIRRRLEKFK
ncbi:MAG: hypothetical protein GXO66_01515 [Euryarchaeota archaeon]|nr:hypothetical protein [Euryarchaeota archaeon]